MHHRKGFMNRRREPLFAVKMYIKGDKSKHKTFWLTKSQILLFLNMGFERSHEKQGAQENELSE